MIGPMQRVRQLRWALRNVAAMALLSCGGPKVDTSWHQETGHRWRALAVSPRGEAGFEQLTASSTGLTHRNNIDVERGLANRGLLDGAGVALGDVDGDGLPEVVLASIEKPAALYHNDGDFEFTDVTAASGLDFTGLATTSVVLADVDGDRDLDLLAGTFGGPVALFTNDGRGHFSNVTSSSGLTGGYNATTMTLADVDGNGSLDLYVATYKTRNALDAYTPQQRAFDQVLKKVGDSVVVSAEWTKEYRVESRPDLGGFMRSQRAEPDLFFLNDGKGHFTATPISGDRFRDEAGRPLREVPDFFTLAARYYDMNGDGAPDLYVCNDLEDPDQFWLNDGRGNFRLAPPFALRVTSNTCMSVDMADVNRDGQVDLFTTDMLAPTLAAQQRSIPTHTPLQKPVGMSPERTQWMRNMLQVNRGDGTYAQVADFAGVTATDWTWGSAFLDVDLDGFEDLLTVNGHRYDVRAADPYDRIRNSFPRVAWNRESAEFPALHTRSIAFRNGGDLTFSDASQRWGFGVDTAISQGMALADLDGDGALDVVVTRMDAPSVVYRSTTSAPRISVRLRGAGANTHGIGAVVTVRSGARPVQSREMTSGGYYLSGSDAQLTFAAAADSSAEVQVRWRSGRVSTIRDARANRLYDIDERAAVAAPSISGDTATPLFSDATALLRGATHVDSLYADFRRQPLLPSRLSQLGPGVSWIDVDQDGSDDLLFGTGRGGRLSALRNVGGRFTAMSVTGDAQRYDLTTVLPVHDGAGGLRLLAGQSNYEADDAATALALPAVLSFGTGARIGAASALVSGDSASVGPMALGDVNGDGIPDLFVGARAIPGAWPLPSRSRLLLGDGRGAFSDDTVNRGAMSALGLVSSALFADLDDDGRPELVVTTEFGPVRVLHNDRGRLTDVTRAMGLGTASSRWNGISAGDFDGDGRLDLVATSWGRNTPWQASTDRPYTLLLARLDEQRLALLFARADSSTQREMPLDGLARLGAALPSVKATFGTFAEFAAADADAVLGAAAKTAVRIGATTFDHMLFLNRSTRFEARSLPAAAQLAPSSGAVVADFNGDGRDDVFLAQNFFPTEINTMRFDAGAGLLLLGDGAGGLVPQSVRASGIAIRGDMRGAAAADYDGDGRVDLAVSQNGAAMTLWHNQRATPGLRLRLRGSAANPLAIGARVRVLGTGVASAVHDVRAGGGAWSMDATTLVLAMPAGASAISVRWPGGAEQRIPVAAGTRELVLTAPR
ncbi:MAG: VCBS repeat-containing protein [Gemmatimonadota bacterium]